MGPGRLLRHWRKCERLDTTQRRRLVHGRRNRTPLRKGLVLEALIVRNTADRWRWELTATSLRERCTTGLKPDWGEVNSLTHKKPNQVVQKAAQNMAWSKSAKFNEEQTSIHAQLGRSPLTVMNADSCLGSQ